MVIGTDDDACGSTVDDTPKYEPSATAEAVEHHLEKLRDALANGGVPIEAFDLDTVATVLDLLDQLWYWAIEESHNPTEASALSACNDNIKALYDVLLQSKRPKIVTAAFRCLAELVKHQSRRGGFCENVLQPVCVQLVRNPNMEPLVEEGIRLLSVIAAAGDAELVLCSDAVSVVLQAMQHLPQHGVMQRHACTLFAALVDAPRADPHDPPAALLLVHIGVVVDFVCVAYKKQSQDTSVSAAVAHVLRVFTDFPQNLDLLVSHRSVLSTLLHLATHHCFTPRTVQDSMLAVGALLPELDTLQKRSVALALKELMTRTAELETLASAIALILRMLRTESDHSDAEESKQSQMRRFINEQQIPQLIAIALDHFGDVDPVLRTVASDALRELVISKLR